MAKEYRVKFNDENKPGFTNMTDEQRNTNYAKFFSNAGRTCTIHDILRRRDGRERIKKIAKQHGYVSYSEKTHIAFKKEI